jgi:hypothetical protein
MITKTKYHLDSGDLLHSLSGPEGVVVFEDDPSFGWVDGEYDNKFFRVYAGVVGPIPDDEKNAILLEEAWSKLRDTRNTLLAACDWTQVADAPVDREAWAAYRQALRDVTLQDGFPLNIIWPNPPES